MRILKNVFRSEMYKLIYGMNPFRKILNSGLKFSKGGASYLTIQPTVYYTVT